MKVMKAHLSGKDEDIQPSGKRAESRRHKKQRSRSSCPVCRNNSPISDGIASVEKQTRQARQREQLASSRSARPPEKGWSASMGVGNHDCQMWVCSDRWTSSWRSGQPLYWLISHARISLLHLSWLCLLCVLGRTPADPPLWKFLLPWRPRFPAVIGRRGQLWELGIACQRCMSNDLYCLPNVIWLGTLVWPLHVFSRTEAPWFHRQRLGRKKLPFFKRYAHVRWGHTDYLLSSSVCSKTSLNISFSGYISFSMVMLAAIKPELDPDSAGIKWRVLGLHPWCVESQSRGTILL